MNKVLFAGIAAIAMTALAPAYAADLPARMYSKAPPMLEPAYNWSGFYVGVNAGYTFGDRDEITTTGQALVNQTNVANNFRPASVRQEREGFIGGGQIGYNWQVSPNWVLGIETDIQYVDVRRETTVLNPAVIGGPLVLNNTFRSRLDYLGTVRGRVGYTWGATMVYATGGFAYGGVDNSASFLNAAGAQAFFGRDRDTRTGYTVGGGLEHMFTPNWSVKGEYLYYDLRSSNLNVTNVIGVPALGPGYDTRVRNDGHIIRAGLNYKFGGPVVARY